MRSLRFIIFILVSLAVQNIAAQNVDTLKLFAKQDPGTFWALVGQYYPFNDAELEKYKYDIRIDENKNINWSIDKLKNIELPCDLLRNKSIKWNEELINVIKDKKDFNFNDLYYNRPLTISNDFVNDNQDLISEINERFIIKKTNDSTTFYYYNDYFDINQNRLIDYGRVSYSGILGQDTTNTLIRYKDLTKFSQYLSRDINDIPLEVLDSLKGYYEEYRITANGKWDLNWEKFLHLNLLYKNNNFYENESIYNCLFKSKMTKEYLDNVYEMLNENESYFELSDFLVTDQIGYVPFIQYLDTLLQYDFEDYMENPKLHGSDNNYIIKPGTLLQMSEASQGPVRFSEIYPSRTLKMENEDKFCLVVSNRTHKIFQKFIISDCKIVPIKLMYNSKWYGKDTLDYWLYMISNFEKSNNIVANGTILLKPIDRDSMKIIDLISSTEISDLKFIQQYLSSSNRIEEFGYFPFKVLNLNQKQDLMFDGINLLASKELVHTIETLKIPGFQFRKSTQPQFKFINVAKVNHQRRLDLLLKTVGNQNPFINQKSIRKYNQVKSEVKRMAKSKDDVAKILSSQNSENLQDSISIKIHDFQIKNNVLLPEYYTSAIKNPNFKTMKTKGSNRESWDVLPIDRVHIVEKEWSQNIPQLYRAVVIAENGVGDYLVLLRKQSSPYEISSQFYALWHEMGEIEEVKVTK